MVSDIKGISSHQAQAPTQNLNKVGEQRQADSPAGAHAGEVVTVTDLASRLQKLSESVQSLPVVDQKAVSQMREALASGTYQIDDRQIADKLTAFEKLLGPAGRG